jgi:polyhydroxyalkanoate synthesis regulator phasin
MDVASEAILALKPVSFRYKEEIDPDVSPQFGLVAEDVEKVNPALVTRDEQGQAETVRYDAVNAMLLNEFLKEHKAFVAEQRKVQEQGATIARLEQQIEALTAGLQKVSAQLELSKTAPRAVVTNE